MLTAAGADSRTEVERFLRDWPVDDISEDGVQVMLHPLVGSCRGEGIYKDKDAAIGKFFQPNGTVFEMHQHKDELEFIGILSGEMVIRYADGTINRVRQHDAIIVPRGMPHEVVFTEDTYTLAVTMPASAKFPCAPRQ